MQSVILIGGSGFLGSEVRAELLAQGYKVFATENKAQIEHAENIVILSGGIKAITYSKIKEINPVAIYHCGRPTFSRLRKLGRKLASYKAAKLNRNLVKAIKRSGVNVPLVFASGSLAYGNSKTAHFEDSPISPISYSKQYITGERPLLRATNTENYPVLILRFPWLIGNGSWFKWFYHESAKEMGKIPIFGDGQNHMSIISVTDAAKLMVEYPKQFKESGVYNIFSPFHPNQLDFLKLIASKYSCDVVDYKQLYPNGLESAVIEAFESNIIMDSKNKELLDNYNFKSIVDSIDHF